MVTKSRQSFSRLLPSLSIFFLLALAGCGGSGSKTNVVTVAVSPPAASIIVSQSITLTSIVGGTTNLNVTWACTYTTTTVDSAGKPTTAKPLPCTSDTGNIPANSTNTTVTYTAPTKVPDPTKFPLLQVIITATSVADPKKSGTATLSLDSGIAVTLTPTTATVPTSVDTTHQSQFQFTATLTNDIDPQIKGANWLITQGTPTTTVPFPSLPTCSPGCGTIDATGLYTAPTTVPTTPTVTLVASSKADPTRFALGTITIILGGPITFNGISPTVVPQGASFYDIYIDAPNMSSASSITLTGVVSGPSVKNSTSGQIKILFPIPTPSLPNPPSTGARLRLFAADLQNADTYTVSIFDPAECKNGCPLGTGHGPVSFEVVPVRPTTVASLPDSIPQASKLPNDFNLTVDGGYFGPSGSLAKITFDGSDLTVLSDSSASRRLNLLVDSSKLASTPPGLYPLSVSRTSPPLPSPANPSVTNLAIFPDYSAVPPSVSGTISGVSSPSAMDIDTRLGVIAVAETGSTSAVAFYDASTLALLPCPVSNCSVSTPTGLSINQSNHTVAVVSPQDQLVKVFPVACPAALTCVSAPSSNPKDILRGDPQISYPITISLAGLLPVLTPAPLPYAIGVDSDSNMALVAYSSSATPTTAKVGFLLDLNKDSQSCLAGAAQTAPPCPHAQVTLNTGTYPQIATLPRSHLALVTPGGAGTLSGIDYTKSSSQLPIKNVSLTSGLVTVTVDLPAGQTLGLNPGNPGSVLIQGIPKTSAGTTFNGAFTVQSVINSTSFTYAFNSTINDSAKCPTDPTAPMDLTKNPCDVYLSTPNITIGISPTAQGVAINPITRVAAITDANATGINGPQIDLLNSLDQSISSIAFRAGCTEFTTSCSNAPELLGTSSVAFQPYSNSLVSYNPQQNQLSISNPVTLRRSALACQLASACAVDPTVPSQIKLPGTGTGSLAVTGLSNPLTLFGALVVDPATNQAFVAQSGSNDILVFNLGPTSSTTLKTAQITELAVPTVSPTSETGIVGALMPQGTLTSNSDLGGVQIFGSGFDASTQVRLDGTPLASGNVEQVSSRILNVTIPAALLAQPHHYAVDVVTSIGINSNATDLFVIKSVDLSKVGKFCKDSAGNFLDAQPNSVAIADQLRGQTEFAPIAVVTNTGCNNVAVIDIAPKIPTFDTSGKFTGFVDNPNFARVRPIDTGSGPQGVAVSPRFGLAVVANNTSGTASILDLVSLTQKIAAVTVGATPTGVAIDEGTGAALIANTGTNTVSEINLALLVPTTANPTPPTTLTALSIAIDTAPIAVAIDPDRGTNNRGLAVVTALQLISGSAPIGVLDAIDIGGSTPAKSLTAQVGSVTATPTGVVFDSSRSPSLFYANSSGGNVVTAFNPDTGATSSVHVGINPTSLAINPQTGGIMTVNSASHTVSIIDTLSNPFKTRSTFGLGGSPQFGIAIDQFLNLAVIADQANNRVLIFPVPN